MLQASKKEQYDKHKKSNSNHLESFLWINIQKYTEQTNISRIYANRSQPNEKSFGWKRKIIWRRMRKSSVGKSPKTSQKREKMDWERPAKSQNGRFDIHLATIKKLPETPLRFTWTIHHAPKPTGLPAKRQPKPPFPYKQETAKPMRIVYFPPRPHSSPNGRFSRGETYFLTFCLTLLLHIHHGKFVPVTLKM